MPIRELIQFFIHKLEVGGGARVLRLFLLLLVIFGVGVLYDLRDYRNLSTPEGMDAAQLARNISTGQGYTTKFIRPLSLYLVQRQNEGKGPTGAGTTNFDFARIQAHPDLANPPVYPLVLAGLMKVLPFHWTVDLKGAFWSDNGRFSRYQPDFLITVFNQMLLLAVAVAVFFLARKLFDQNVAWLSAVLTICCEVLWRFSNSGLSTLLLILIFLGLTWCVLKIEELAREATPRQNHLLGWVILAGATVAVGALTRYAFGWLILPVALFLTMFSGRRGAAHAVLAVGVFAIILAPWLVRNYIIGGTLFGTAGFAPMEGTSLYPQYTLPRSIHPVFYGFVLKPFLAKLAVNARGILSNDLPTLGGSWASAFFLAGLMLQFRKTAAQRMRYFVLLCLGVLIFTQALGRTQLSDESPTVNSENLLILLAPLVFIYGASFFLTLLEQIQLPVLELRYPIVGGFVVLSCLPMIFTLLPPTPSPVVYPPYFPPDIQQVSRWMRPDELMMSDVPWAVAWYGDRDCVWLSLNVNNDFYDINDNIKTVSALYLTPVTMNGKYLTDWKLTPPDSWGNFIIQFVVLNQPSSFPLHDAPTGYSRDRLFLTDFPRWRINK